MNFHNLTYPDMNNGEGLRVVLWLSGCSHKCKGCQNTQTWDANSGILFDEAAKEELLRELNKEYISGLTLSGGDPLFENNLDDVLNLVNEIRISCPKKSIWIYSGYTFNEIFPIEIEDNAKMENIIKRQQIIKQCDVLVDGRYIDSMRDINLKWRGSANQRVINIQESLRRNKLVLYCE